MKNLLLLGLPVLLMATAFTFTGPPTGSVHRAAAKKFDPKDWIINEATAQRMLDHYRNCRGGRCRQFKKETNNPEVEAYLRQQYTIIKAEQLMGRYTDADMDRYRRARNIPANDPRGDVSGYSTVITKYTVQAKGGSVFFPAMFVFVDSRTICPPPEMPPCN